MRMWSRWPVAGAWNLVLRRKESTPRLKQKGCCIFVLPSKGLDMRRFDIHEYIWTKWYITSSSWCWNSVILGISVRLPPSRLEKSFSRKIKFLRAGILEPHFLATISVTLAKFSMLYFLVLLKTETFTSLSWVLYAYRGMPRMQRAVSYHLWYELMNVS